MTFQIPTPMRLVLVTLLSRLNVLVTLPAMITHVHNDKCVSIVVFSAFSDDGMHAGGTLPMTSVLYDESGKPNTWRWNDYQRGQAAKADQIAGDVHKQLSDQLAKAEETLAKQLLEAVTNATGPLVEKLADLQGQLAALNAKQPAGQRLAVTDPTPVSPEASGEVIGKNPDGTLVRDSGGAPTDGSTPAT